jgi:hypothetical protein
LTLGKAGLQRTIDVHAAANCQRNSTSQRRSFSTIANIGRSGKRLAGTQRRMTAGRHCARTWRAAPFGIGAEIRHQRAAEQAARRVVAQMSLMKIITTISSTLYILKTIQFQTIYDSCE